MDRKRTLMVAVLVLDTGFLLFPLLRAAHAGERLASIVSTVKLVAILSRE